MLSTVFSMLASPLRHVPRWAVPTWPLLLVAPPGLVSVACDEGSAPATVPLTATAAATAEQPPLLPPEPAAAGFEDEAELGTTWGPGLTLIAGRGTPQIMLARLDQEPAQHGPPTSTDQAYVVEASVADADLPTGARAFATRPLEVITDRGERCAATADGFAYRVDVVPDSHEWEQWQLGGQGDLDAQATGTPPADQPARAQAIWQSAYSRWLTARAVVQAPAQCEGQPLFARPLDGADVRVGTPVEPPPAAQVTNAFRLLPEYAAIQRDYERYLRDDDMADTMPPRWELADRAPVVQAFALSGQRYVSVSVPFAGCSPWDPGLWAVFHWPGDGEPHAIHVSNIHAPERVRMIVRVPGEPLDFIVQEHFTDGLTVVRDERRLATWTSEFHGCGC